MPTDSGTVSIFRRSVSSSWDPLRSPHTSCIPSVLITPPGTSSPSGAVVSRTPAPPGRPAAPPGASGGCHLQEDNTNTHTLSPAEIHTLFHLQKHTLFHLQKYTHSFTCRNTHSFTCRNTHTLSPAEIHTLFHLQKDNRNTHSFTGRRRMRGIPSS